MKNWGFRAPFYVEKLNDMLRECLIESRTAKARLIKSQETIIDLQNELLQHKGEQLQSVQNSVAATVKAEFTSYSAAVQNAKEQEPSPVIAQETLKKVVKTVVEEEDRTRSVMLFGLQERENEVLDEEVGAVLQELGEKPKIEACRIGPKKVESTRPRPVKVTFCNSPTARLVLTKAKALRKTESYSTVYITPDRTPEEQEAHRELVKELKRRTLEQRTHRHYISRGQVWSVVREDGQ